MDYAEAVRERSGFDVPGLLRRMAADGVTRYGASVEEWRETWRRRMIDDPPALLFAWEVEWWTPDAMAEWTAPGYWDAALGLVPLAGTGAGDVWAFCPGRADERGTPIVLVLHDLNEATLFAPDLEGFLYRHALNACAIIRPSDWGDFTDHERVRAIRANARVLRPYLRPAWGERVESIAAREAVSVPGHKHLTLLPGEELRQILETDLAWPRLDGRFAYQRP